MGATVRQVLHVGCGPATLESMPSFFHSGEWEEVRLDIDMTVAPDVVGTILDMGIIANGSVDAVFSSHNIEHVYPHEVGQALQEFRRVLHDDGLAVVRCPDIQSVAQVVGEGRLMDVLYVSPAGPISAIDIMYGHRAAIQGGNLFMSHKTAFTADTLAKHLKDAGFEMVIVARDRIFGLHAIAYCRQVDELVAERDCALCFPALEGILGVVRY
ncbi:MAG: class I SAM-dependent methyltransferase [Pseudazoarcus pumilus]|nr:class I SAM-dependent methyltransferase [Pseudazoarcus pumilus]